MLGEPGDENLEAERTYSNQRTMWVEPITGAVLDREEQQLSTLRYDGTDRVTLTEAEVSYTDESVQETADTVRSKAVLLKVLNPIVPIGGSIAGALLILLGIFLARRPKPAPIARGAEAHADRAGHHLLSRGQRLGSASEPRPEDGGAGREPAAGLRPTTPDPVVALGPLGLEQVG